MPSSTTKYGIPYAVGTDPRTSLDTTTQSMAERIANIIESLGSDSAPKLVTLLEDSATGLTTNSTTYVSDTTVQITFTTGKSGLFLVSLYAELINSVSTNRNFATYSISGAITRTANDNFCISTIGSPSQTGQIWYLYQGTPDTSTTVTFAKRTSGGTTTYGQVNLQVIAIG